MNIGGPPQEISPRHSLRRSSGQLMVHHGNRDDGRSGFFLQSTDVSHTGFRSGCVVCIRASVARMPRLSCHENDGVFACLLYLGDELSHGG